MYACLCCLLPVCTDAVKPASEAKMLSKLLSASNMATARTSGQQFRTVHVEPPEQPLRHRATAKQPRQWQVPQPVQKRWMRSEKGSENGSCSNEG